MFSKKKFIQTSSGIIQGRTSTIEWRLRFIKAVKRKSAVLASIVTLLVVLSGVLTVSFVNSNIELPKYTNATSAKPSKQVNSISLHQQNKENSLSDQKEISHLKGNILDRNGLNLVRRTPTGNYYTEGNLASHVIGFIDKENT